MKKKIIPSFLFLAGILCLLFSLIPICFYHIFNLGALLLLAAGLFFIFIGIFWHSLWNWYRHTSKLWAKRLFSIGCGVCLAGILCLAGFFTVMAKAAYFTPPQEGDNTIIVLGCLIQGDSPSQMLAGRLDKAVAYLQAHPQARCIVSGGQGENEDYTEAYVMAEYLISHGISPDRILKEEDSTDTEENLLFSSQLIRSEGLSEDVVIVTDDFHMFRAMERARQNGLTPTALPSQPPWALAPCYWLREVFGIVEMYLF